MSVPASGILNLKHIFQIKKDEIRELAFLLEIFSGHKCQKWLSFKEKS